MIINIEENIEAILKKILESYFTSQDYFQNSFLLATNYELIPIFGYDDNFTIDLSLIEAKQSFIYNNLNAFYLAKKRKCLVIFKHQKNTEDLLYSAAIPLFLQDTILGFIGIFKAEHINEKIKICLEMFVKCINIELSRIVTMKNLNDILNEKGISKWEELLSSRELEIVDLLIKGLKDYQIEEKLFISKSTVRAHIGSIFEKLKVKSRLELIDKHHRYIIKEIKDILLKYEI